MSTPAVSRFTSSPVSFWSVSAGTGRRLFHDVGRAARYIADESFRLGRTDALTVARLDKEVDETWNAGSDVADVLNASRWPEDAAAKGTLAHVRLRAEVIVLLEAILVTDSAPEGDEC